MWEVAAASVGSALVVAVLAAWMAYQGRRERDEYLRSYVDSSAYMTKVVADTLTQVVMPRPEPTEPGLPEQRLATALYDVELDGDFDDPTDLTLPNDQIVLESDVVPEPLPELDGTESGRARVASYAPGENPFEDIGLEVPRD